MNTRTDIHAPSKINPENYEYVAQEYSKMDGLGDALVARENREFIRAHMTRTGGTYSQHQHGGTCHICGSVNAIYTVLFYHRPTNTYIRTGQDCAEKLGVSSESMNLFRKQVKNAREAAAGKRKAIAILSDAGLSAAWDNFASEATGNQESIIRSIVGKLVQYGSISEKQIAFVRTLLVQIADRPRIEAERAAAKAAAADCPAGRVTIVGTIVSTKVVESMYGMTEKMLVIAESGFKVWGTMPGSLAAGKGDKIEFTATVEASKDDAKFGFFKRPTGAKVLVSANPEPAAV